jgi:lipoprotein NlpI
MQRWVVRLLLPVLLAGCAPHTDLQAVRAQALAVEQQSSVQHQTMETQIQQMSDRIADLEQAQATARRDVARVAATVAVLRRHLHRLQGAIQQTRRQVQRGPTEREQSTAARLTQLDIRLRVLQKHLRVAS